jgi:hypothetical protein
MKLQPHWDIPLKLQMVNKLLALAMETPRSLQSFYDLLEKRVKTPQLNGFTLSF